jgi:hypothetical protein
MGGEIITDSRIKPTTTAAQQNVVGVVMGRFRTDEPNNEFEDADCLDGDVAAVVIAGKAFANVEGSVVVGQYAYSAATDGAAYGTDYLAQGGMGSWETGGTTRQWLRLWGAPATPGVIGSILTVFGDGLTLLATGTSVDVSIPFNVRLTDWVLLSTATGSVSIDIYKSDYANFPPPPWQSITETSPPTITSGVKAQGTVPGPTQVGGLPPAGGWDRDLDTGDVLRFNVESAAYLTQVSLLLRYVRR